MTTQNKQRHNSSISGASVLLGVKPETIEACYKMLKYIDGLDEEQLKYWKENNKYHVESKKVV